MAETVKTTLELPADLMQQLKLLAVQEHRRIKDVAADALRRGLLPEQRPDRIRHRVKLPLIRGGHPAAPGEGSTPARIAQLEEDDDLERFFRSSRVHP